MRRTPHGGSGTDHGHIAQTELLKFQRFGVLIYYKEKKRDLKRRPTYEYRYDERLKVEGSTRLVYTGLLLCFYYRRIKKGEGLLLVVFITAE